jgi:hypothetical protein
MTTTDEHVVVTSSATITLPAISTLLPAGVGVKTYAFEVSGSGVTITIAQNSADTVNGGTSNITLTGDGAIIELVSDAVRKNWEIASDMPYLSSVNLQDNAVTTAKITDDSVTGAKLSIGAHYGIKVVETNGTTAVNVFSASGAPAALTITGVMAIAKDTVANTEVVLTNGTLAVATFDKLNTVGWVIAEEADMTNETVTSGDTLTVVTDTTGNAQVWITFESA